jgi:hypothetical protein
LFWLFKVIKILGKDKINTVQTQVISVLVGEATSGPPVDSWAWWKYEQKPNLDLQG